MTHKPMTEERLREIEKALPYGIYVKDSYIDIILQLISEIRALRKVAEAGIKLRDDKSKSAAEFKKALKESGWL